MNKEKILIVSRGVWDDALGTSSTLTNIFEDYPPDRLAHIYIETKRPNTSHCFRFFQISEFSLVHKLVKWGLKTGYAFDTRDGEASAVSGDIARQEASVMSAVRSHRSILFTILREVLWRFNGWKSKELVSFIRDFDPDVVWLDGSPLPLMYRLYKFVLEVARKPAVIFMQDDVYTYEGCEKGLVHRLFRKHLRKKIDTVIPLCSDMFVASPKMKREYDAIFGFDSTFIAKSNRIKAEEEEIVLHHPLKMVYMGQVLYGRLSSLQAIAGALSVLNKEGIQGQLFIYTNNPLSKTDKENLVFEGTSSLMAPVPYSEVPGVIADSDVVIFVESFEEKMNKLARLSFSTKISDYMGSGKCIFAVGPKDLAPIEFLVEEDAAVVANSRAEILQGLSKLMDGQTVIQFSEKTRACNRRNFNREDMDRVVYGRLSELAGLPFGARLK